MSRNTKVKSVKPLAIEFRSYGCKLLFVHCAYPELVRFMKRKDPSTDVSDLKDAVGGAIGHLLWVNTTVTSNTMEFIATVVHEAVHCVDTMTGNLGLQGTEVRAYSIDYVVSTVLAHTGCDKLLAA